MVPVYSMSTLLLNWFYWHSVYFQLVSATYAAIAVASYFTLVCNFVAGCVHDYKAFFRGVTPKPWGSFFPIPIGWFRACCGGERGIWRTPRSGLTLFNVRQLPIVMSNLLTSSDLMLWGLSIQLFSYRNVNSSRHHAIFWSVLPRVCHAKFRPHLGMLPQASASQN
jgi:hypothetical protein